MRQLDGLFHRGADDADRYRQSRVLWRKRHAMNADGHHATSRTEISDRPLQTSVPKQEGTYWNLARS
jgi:hypothetical protein